MFRANLPLCRLEQIDAAPGVYQIRRRHAIQLSGEYPYRQSKKTVGTGGSAIEAALQTGFSDQSHFTKYFNRFIGLAPGVYREIYLE